MMQIALLLLLSAAGASAAEINGGDWHGADLVPANYDILRGTFVNVGNFTVVAGRTVLAATGERLAVYAATATIAGHLNASGSGLPGGAAGGNGLPGANGFGPVAGGAGSGGAVGNGGGGGGHADPAADGSSGGRGGPAGVGGAGGFEYGQSSALGIPLSLSDAFMGSGGGGGGGGSAGGQSGGGGAGGGAVYIEAGYVVVSGTISADGLIGGVGITPGVVAQPASGGGGGSAGDILIRAAGPLNLSGARLSSLGGEGGSAISGGGSPNPGGGGSAGRVRLIYNSVILTGVKISTDGGAGGDSNFGGVFAQAGSSGTISFGLLPSSPAAFALTDVYKTSAAYSWTGKGAGEWGGPVSADLSPLTVKQFRLYQSTTGVPFASFYTGSSAASGASALTETGLSPDTAISRMLASYTDFGNSAPSLTVSTITRAAAPAGGGFSSASESSVSVLWSSGTAAEGFNPAYTTYEVFRSSVPGLASAVASALTVGVSSAPAGLAPNTTYYFRVRALGLNGAYTGYTQDLSTPTLAAAPSAPAFDGVFVDSVAFSWGGGQNPPGTRYEAQLSVNGFQSVAASSLTFSTAASFGALNPGVIYYLRVRAVNHTGRAGDFTLTVSTIVGQLGTLESPARPEPPQPASAYSYDGTAVFAWAPPSGAVPIYRYWLDIGTTPGGNDFVSGQAVLASGALSYSTNTLVSGKTYYARVRAESGAGVLGEFSAPGRGVAVWLSQAQPPVAKPYNWPNPFDPRVGATNIGFGLAGPARVTLTIYTLQGRRVREATVQEASGGNKVWSWDGRNGAGRMVEPGGYLAVITKKYPGSTEVQKFKVAVLY